jgi:hypothetical protein
MLRQVLMGMAAGAAGTAALNVAGYLDMAIRGRPASQVPAQTAGELAARIGAPLDGQQAQARKEGLGGLLGYGAGLGVGALYGLLRPSLGELPLPLAAAGLGAAAMAAGDVPPISLGLTDPREWGASGWLGDLVPHAAYGLVAAAAYEAFTAGELGRRSTSGPAWAAAAARHSAHYLRR